MWLFSKSALLVGLVEMISDYSYKISVLGVLQDTIYVLAHMCLYLCFILYVPFILT